MSPALRGPFRTTDEFQAAMARELERTLGSDLIRRLRAIFEPTPPGLRTNVPEFQGRLNYPIRPSATINAATKVNLGRRKPVIFRSG